MTRSDENSPRRLRVFSLKTLLRHDVPVRTYLVNATSLSLVGGFIGSLLLYAAFPDSTAGEAVAQSFEQLTLVELVFALVVFAPAVETALLMVVLALVRRLVHGLGKMVILAAAVAALAHSSSVPGWGVGVFLPFCVFSAAGLVWWRRSLLHGAGMSALVHAAHNACLVPILLLDS